jgi:hypothetical protein
MSNYSPMSTAEPKKQLVWPWILLGAAIVVLGAFAACAAVVGSVVISSILEGPRTVTINKVFDATNSSAVDQGRVMPVNWQPHV